MRRVARSLFDCAAALPAVAWAVEGAQRRLLPLPDSVARIRAGLTPGSGIARLFAATRGKADRYVISSPDVPAPVAPGGGDSRKRHELYSVTRVFRFFDAQGALR